MAYIPTESMIENATMSKRLYEDSTEVRRYRIHPNEGYAVHSTNYDTYKRDEFGEDTEEILPGFISYPSDVEVAGNYDFDNVVEDVHAYVDENGITQLIPIRKVGIEEIYCVPIGSLQENQIFNNGGPEHEVM